MLRTAGTNVDEVDPECTRFGAPHPAFEWDLRARTSSMLGGNAFCWMDASCGGSTAGPLDKDGMSTLAEYQMIPSATEQAHRCELVIKDPNSGRIPIRQLAVPRPGE